MKNTLFKKLRENYSRFQISKSPQFNLMWGFFLYSIIGWLLLSIPLFHQVDISFLDNLFISASAVSTTGLVTVDIFNSYNFGGQLIVMILFQIGGIGYMTLTTYYLLFTTQTITSWHKRIIGAEFTMPESIRVQDFIKSVIIFTIVMEILGTVSFFIAFSDTGMGTWQSVWFAIFHSVSAFCTAGFSLFSNGFEGFQDDTFVNTIISVLAIAGSLGFILITDLWYRISGRSSQLTFTSKIVLYGFCILLIGGTSMFYFTEPLVHSGNNSSLMSSFFLAMTSMTTVGFNTIPTGSLALPLLLLVIFLMYIGASPSGTAGGMKITTLTAVISILKSRLFGQRSVTFLNRKIPFERLYVATSTFTLYTSLIFFFTFLLSFTETFPFEEILFEVASALGTVGLSTGITGDLSSAGKVFIVILMFIGRVGVLTFGFALLARKNEDRREVHEDDLAV